jgi:polysaccharide biosynthesis transport protein
MNSEDLPVLPVRNVEALPITQEASRSDAEERPSSSGINVHDILLMLYRHKWKIIFFGLAGLLAAAGVYLLVPPIYQSGAKLLVRYVVDHSAVDTLDTQINTPSPENGTVINSEVVILNSSDLVRQVVESVGIDRIAKGAGIQPTTEKVVEYIDQNLSVSVVKGTNIISVAFTSSNASLPLPVVQELVKRYFDRHLEVHRSTNAFNFVEQETGVLKKKLDQTEAELKQLKESAGIISIGEAKADIAAEIGKTQQELDSAVADLAAQQARVKDLGKSLPVAEPQVNQSPTQPVSGDILEQYKSLVARLTEIQRAENELLLKYTPENPMVKVKAAQIAELEKQRSNLEKAYPALLNTVVAAAASGGAAEPSMTAERAILAGLESRVSALQTRMSSLQARAKTISEFAPRIEDLERKSEVEVTNYTHSEASLEKARIDETLDPSRIPNISVVETPSPATRVKRNIQKVVLVLAGGGWVAGIAIALLIEMILDQTVKRSLDLEERLALPLLLSIPYLQPTRKRLRDVGNNAKLLENGDRRPEWIDEHRDVLLKPFCEAIRDRLSLFFEVNNMSYRPKLVGVAGLTDNAGTSTLAAGVTEALSDAFQGRVLLIDKPVPTKQFYDMLTEFKQSDLDYVVFDLPCLGDTSSTLPLARFMDTVLLIVEAGKSSRKAVKRAYAQLSAKTKVSVIFNKSRSYGPRWLEGKL